MIEIGAEAKDRPDSGNAGYTFINKVLAATGTGTIDSVELFGRTDITGCKVGIFYKTNGNRLKCRSVVTIGDFTAGSKKTYSVSLAVQAGDYMGEYHATGTMEKSNSGEGGDWYCLGDHCVVDDEDDYTLQGNDAVSLYGTGTQSGWTGKVAGVTDPAKVAKVDAADITSVKGVS